MPSTTYQAVLDQVAALAGEDATALGTLDAAVMLQAINRRLRHAWDFWDWPEAMRVEERTYRANYAAATAYTVGTQVYFPATRGYYQALRSTTGNAPATRSSGTWTVNAAYWIECSTAFSGQDWAASTAYTAGTIVRHLDDGLHYACHTAHTSSSTFDASKFGLLTDFVPYVAYEQNGKTALGVVRQVYRDNPRVELRPRKLSFRLIDLGVNVLGPTVPASVWLHYRTRCTAMTGDTAQAFPLWLLNAVATGAYADWLRGDGQTDKAIVEDQKAMDYLAAEVRLVAGQTQPIGNRITL